MVDENNLTNSLQSSKIQSIFRDQQWKFKINAAIGCVLINHSEATTRYFHASPNNDRLFDNPWLIETSADFENFVEQLQNNDFVENAVKKRPDTAWSLHSITNISFYVYPIVNHPIGNHPSIPQHVRNNKAIVTGDKDTNGRMYTDNMCLFRAMAYMNGKLTALERTTVEYLEKYLTSKKESQDEFAGVSLEDLSLVEEIFALSIYVYRLELTGDTTTAYLVRNSQSRNKTKLYLHLEDRHYCWIKNIRMYTKSYKCSFCSKLFKSGGILNRHASMCSSQTKLTYPNGVYTIPKTIFDKLDEYDIRVDRDRRHYPYFAVFDTESYFDKSNLPKNTNTMVWEAEHKLASISIASNVPGFTEPICFVNENNDSYSVVSKMMEYLEKLSSLCYHKLMRKYDDIFEALSQKKSQLVAKEETVMDGIGVERLEKIFDNLETKLDEYLSEMLVFGFNSGSYDIPLIKNDLVRYLSNNDQEAKFVVKKGNSYMCLQTDKLQFLDVTNYLAPGFSYSAYLKAMEVEEKKFFWIYEKFTSLEVLKQTSFPAKEDFYSQLKQEAISQEDYDYCKSVWNKRGMKTLKDLLVYYNNEDCRGFVQALEKQSDFFRSKNLDFKMASSMPGLAIQRMMTLKNSMASIFLFGDRQKDLYHTVRANIRGGQSIVWNRYQEKDVTKIKSEYFGEAAKTTAVCLGVDISGMYLSNLMRDMPTGSYIRRRKCNEFKIEKRSIHGQLAVEWISYMERELGIKCQHMYNNIEQRCGGRQLPVDGYAKIGNDEYVLQFLGCYFHSHMCVYSPKGKHALYEDNLKNQLKTYRNLNYLKDLGYIVHHIWECEFVKMKKENHELNVSCQNQSIVIDKRWKLTEKQIIDEVKSGQLFGMVECDINTPDHLKTIFSEYQPITKHSQVSREDLSEHMKKFAITNKLLKSSTKTLVNSYFAKKILLATPLLKWYLNHGLEVTTVHQVIQYNPVKCFSEFGHEVMDARRLGDIDPTKKIISDSCKLMGKKITATNMTYSLY